MAGDAARTRRLRELREFAGFLSAEIEELHHVEIYRLDNAVQKFVAVLDTEGDQPTPPQDGLPRRDIPALITALRIRALALTGEAWERTATQDMMKEAAERLEEFLLPDPPVQP